MRWQVKQGDILDQPTDVLICSANPFLTLSGGVGGALLLKYGAGLASELTDYLARSGKRFADRGSVVVTHPQATPYRAVIHAVAVDGMYESSPAIVTAVLRESMRAAAEVDAREVAVTALATGYGRLSPAGFAEGVSAMMSEQFKPIERALIVVRKPDEAEEISQVLGLGGG